MRIRMKIWEKPNPNGSIRVQIREVKPKEPVKK